SSFDGCTALKTINVDSANASYSSYDGVLYNKAKTQYICCPAGKTSINIPGTLATVPGTKLKAAITSVTLNEGTKTLEKWAFINCKDMKSLTIPQSVTSIGQHAVGFCHLSGDQTDPDTPISSFIIYGYKGSAAETYAKSNGITFKEIGTACSHTYGTPAWTWNGYTSATATFTCTKCSNKQTVNATITNAVTKAATCSATGVRTYTAKATFGGTSYTSTKTETIAINANAHSWNTSPTWTWNGYTSASAKFTCKNNSLHTQSVNASSITNAVTKAATCSATGVRTYTAKATFGGTSYTNTKTETIAVNANAHSWKTPTYTWSSDNKTCTATRVCANNANHKESETVTATVSTSAASCTAGGSTTYTATFKNSAFAKQTKTTTTAALGHNYNTKTVAPTCEAQGYTEHKCTRCGDIYKDNYKNALGHSYTTTVVKPTCTAQGYTLHKCTRCTYSYKSDYTDMVEHSWSEWKVTKPATESTTGTKERTCSVCKKKETATIPVTTHTHVFNITFVEPTCTSQGYTLHVCKTCGETNKDNFKSALGHSYTHTVVKPTVLKTGYTLHKCTRAGCGYSYQDSQTPKATIRLSGKNRYETSMKIADQLKAENGGAAFKSVIIASGTSFADALSAAYLARVKNSGNTPILLVANAASIMDSAAAYVKKNAASTAAIYIVGGEAVVPKAMETKLKANGFKNVKRLAGRTRYLTNIEVLKEAGVTNQDMLVASGMDYADALSASAAGRPILLAAPTGLTAEQKAFLKNMKNSAATIIGGKNAVNAATENQLRATFKSVTRIGGSNRFETSVLVAKKFFPKAPAVTLAYGLDYPDGLCGGPLAMTYKCPLLLTTSTNFTQAKNYAKSIGASSGAVYGGTGLISEIAVKNILS
ncbi:MAG: cell wall-binding repeat-containing protein, partial [Ruminococcus sp.]|nr:cell wall-binding repeat-containing protein [Ruminococcus sp.]